MFAVENVLAKLFVNVVVHNLLQRSAYALADLIAPLGEKDIAAVQKLEANFNPWTFEIAVTNSEQRLEEQIVFYGKIYPIQPLKNFVH